MARVVGGLAGKPYHGGQGEIGVESTSSGLQVRGCFFG